MFILVQAFTAMNTIFIDSAFFAIRANNTQVQFYNFIVFVCSEGQRFHSLMVQPIQLYRDVSVAVEVLIFIIFETKLTLAIE